MVRKDLAVRLSGLYGSSQFSIKNKPWFEFSIYYRFNRSDFVPRASMDCVMWRITRRKNLLIPTEEKQNYQRFIELAFGDGGSIENNLRRFLSKDQLNKLSKNLNLSLKVKPSHLSFAQWIEIYKVYR